MGAGIEERDANFIHGGICMAIDPRIPTMARQSTSGFILPRKCCRRDEWEKGGGGGGGVITFCLSSSYNH